MRQRFSVHGLLTVALLVAFSTSLVAQETPPAEPPAAPDSPPGEPAAPQTPAEPAVPAETTPPADPATPATPAPPAETEFTKLFAEWKGIIVQLRTLQEQYKLAKPEERAAIETQFNELLAKGSEMAPKLEAAAAADYAAAPNANPDVGNFLASVVYADATDDKYEEAMTVAQPLLDNNYPNPDLYNFAGIAAFVLGDYDKADALLKKGEAAGALNPLGKNYLGLVAEYKELAAKEKTILEAEAQANDLPRVLFKTSKGDVTIELFENEAPNTVANFISLVESGFYNGLTFHRVIGNFMAQGGDPKGDGSGGPGYTIVDEFDKPGARNHFRGYLSMAKTEAPNSGGSQFFLTFVPTAHLNGKHTVFGRVVEGMDVLAKLNRTEPVPAKETDKIIEASVIRKRDHEYKPAKVGDPEPGTPPPAAPGTPPATPGTPPATP